MKPPVRSITVKWGFARLVHEALEIASGSLPARLKNRVLTPHSRSYVLWLGRVHAQLLWGRELPVRLSRRGEPRDQEKSEAASSVPMLLGSDAAVLVLGSTRCNSDRT